MPLATNIIVRSTDTDHLGSNSFLRGLVRHLVEFIEDGRQRLQNITPPRFEYAGKRHPKNSELPCTTR